MLSVVIPAYNEEKAIKKTLLKLKRVLRKQSIKYEIIVVDDCSTDNTGNVARQQGATVIYNRKNTGYGYSLKRGIKNAKYDTILILDADLTYPVEYIPKFIKYSSDYDLIIGCRMGNRGSHFKVFLRKILQFIIECITKEHVPDVNSGMRLFHKEVVKEYLPQLCNTFSFTTSQTLAYYLTGKSVIYLFIPYHNRCGKSKVKLLKDSLITLKYIFKIMKYYRV